MTDDNDKGNLNSVIEEAVELAENTVRHPYTKTLARLGFYTKGFLFTVIGILAILVAVGVKSGELTTPDGALKAIAQISFGKIVLIIFTVGAVCHGIWNVLRGIADIDGAGGGWQGIIKRIIPAGIGAFYLMLAWTAWDLIVRVNSSGTNEAIQKTFTAILLSLPFGAIIVGLIGLIVVGAGIHELYSGISGKYLAAFRLGLIKNDHRKIISALGFFSFTARALIFVLMGYYFFLAAIDYNPNEAIGMDGALLTLAQSYFGKSLLFITAVGLICNGILSFYEAKYRHIC